MGRLRTFAGELDLYRRLVGARLRSQMQYKASFALQVAGNFAGNFVELLAIFILFRHFSSLGGWSVGEVAFLFGLSGISFGIAHSIGAGFATFSAQIVRGEFDRVLTRPVGTLLQVLASDVQLYRIGSILQGVIAFGIALHLTHVQWSLGRALYVPIVIVAAAILFTALFALEATLCFWTTEATEVVNAFTYGGTTLAEYPIHIFDSWLRRAFLYVIPLGLIIYEPALYLLRKPDPLDLPPLVRFLGPLSSLAFAAVAWYAWTLGVRHYRSTGS